MKAFNIRTIVLALFTGGLLLASCKDGAAPNNQTNPIMSDNQETTISTAKGEDIPVAPSSTLELDSMKLNIENLKKQIGESTNRANKYEDDINHLKEQDSSIKLCMLLSLVLGIISLVIAIIAFAKASKFNKRLDKHGNEIYNLKQSANSRFSPAPRQNGSDDYQLKSRLRILEDEVKALKRNKNTFDDNRVSPYTPNRTTVPTPTPVPVVETQKGYFGQPTQADRGYFRSFLTARDSEARFSAEEKNNVANFEPLLNTRAELETLLHTDAAKLAVDFEGCSLQEANQAKVIKPGVAKLEGNRWYITQKALVALTR